MTLSKAYAQPLVASSAVQAAALVSPAPLAVRIYAVPFVPVYAAWLYVRIFLYDELLGSPEFALFSFLIVVALHALSFLVTLWSVRARTALTCRTESDPYTAKAIMILPAPHCGTGAFCDLQLAPSDQNGSKTLFFLFQQKKFIYNPDRKRFEKIDYLSSQSHSVAFYNDHRGIASSAAIKAGSDKYGPNRFEVPIPSFQDLFKEHIVAPFFVFQLFCVALWFLDEMWYFSLFTLFMLFTFESTVVFQRLRNLQEFRAMSIKPYPIHVYRAGSWISVQTDELLPGDLCSIVRQKDESPVPADMVLVSGSCIANEAMLSGESTPQLKEPVALRDSDDIFDIRNDKNNTLFGGTKILQVTPHSAITASADGSDVSSQNKTASPITTPPDRGCLAVVLRTGFGTQQGKLVRTIIYATERVSANNIESLFFILFLLVFAVAASWYVWTNGHNDEERNQSKLLLHCVLIITSVVPPELPMELSLAVNNSLMALAKGFIYCTEPFRIPFAGRIDVACFDKTGTLTAENLIVEGVTGLTAPVDDLKLPKDLPVATTHALAAAHALVRLEDGIIGDPMEKNTLESINWTLGSNDTLMPKPATPSASRSSKTTIRIMRRFPFSSALKRMSTISLLEESGGSKGQSTRTLIAAKGAPETIRDMLSSVPEGYDEHYKYWARRGKRVLAIAYRHASRMTPAQMRDLTREQTECDLTFAGFLIFYCPLKPDAVEAIHMLNESSHRVVMITGDNALTASHIAKEVEIVRRDVLIADVWDDEELAWQSVDEKVRIKIDVTKSTFDSSLAKYDLCCTGRGLAAMVDQPCFAALLPRIWIYARVSPSQKELILTRLKLAGYYTLMCGDGTNDVGALKQAHVGIALLDSTVEDVQKIARIMHTKRQKDLFEKQNEMRIQWKVPPLPIPTSLYTPEEIKTMEARYKEMQVIVEAGGRPAPKPKVETVMEQMMNQMDDEMPKIKFGDASVAAPFTSKVTNVMSVVNIIRQGRATLVAMVQMYKILGLNSIITAYSLSVLHLAGIKQGDWQATIAGMLLTVCFFGIANSAAIEKLSKQRPQPNIFNFYIILSVLGQAAVHIAALIYIRSEALKFSEEIEEDLPIDAEFRPNLLNSAVYLVSLIMQISTFAINYQGLPFRQSIFQNRAVFNSIVIVSLIAFAAAAEVSDELNDWMQLVPFPNVFRSKLLTTMAMDYASAWTIEMVCKFAFSNNRAKASLFPKTK